MVQQYIWKKIAVFKAIEKQAKDGIDFMAIHCSVNKETLKRLKRQGREGGL